MNPGPPKKGEQKTYRNSGYREEVKGSRKSGGGGTVLEKKKQTKRTEAIKRLQLGPDQKVTSGRNNIGERQKRTKGVARGNLKNENKWKKIKGTERESYKSG